MSPERPRTRSLQCRPPNRNTLTLAGWLILALVPAAGAETNRLADLPSFKYVGVVLEAKQLKYRPHDDIIYPSVLRMDGHISKPLGKYYMYYAPHDTPGGICLAYADKPEGPWTEYATNPIITRGWAPHYAVSHVSGADAIWNEEEKKLFLYYHGENNVTRLAASGDGIHFEYGGAVVTEKMFDNVSEASYGRIFRHTLPGKENRYVMLLMGNNAGIRRIYLAWSQDGRTWESRRTPVVNPPPGTDQVAGAVYLPRGGRHYLIFHANNSKVAFNQGYDLYVAETDVAFEEVTHLGKFIERSFVSATNPAIMSPCILEDEAGLSLFFNVGPRLQNKIALATEIKSPSPRNTPGTQPRSADVGILEREPRRGFITYDDSGDQRRVILLENNKAF